MNHINSLILEGKVEKLDAFLTIGVSRVVKNQNGENETQTSFFDVITTNLHHPIIKVGDQIRVVGRLYQDGSTIRVLAEHIERRCQ